MVDREGEGKGDMISLSAAAAAEGLLFFQKKVRERVENKGFEHKAFYLVCSRRVLMS